MTTTPDNPHAQMTHGIRIAPDGTFDRVRVDGTLENLVAHTGGDYVEVVQLSPRIDAWMDEEGRLVARPERNLVASRVAHAVSGDAWDFVGPILLTGRKGENTVGLRFDDSLEIINLALEAGGTPVYETEGTTTR